jgi:hypothetical protein
MCLAEHGYDVTVLTRGDALAPDATPIHYRECIVECYERMGNFRAVFHAAATEIGTDFVRYRGEDGAEHTIACDSVVALGGMRARQTEALEFTSAAQKVFRIGDCRAVGCIRDCNRSAFVTAMGL